MAIRLQNVTYIYNNNLPDSRKALDNISLEIKEGKINAITGSNGSGKTTLVEIVNGVKVLPEHLFIQWRPVFEFIDRNVKNKNIQSNYFY